MRVETPFPKERLRRSDEFLLDNPGPFGSFERVSERGFFISFEGVDGCGKSTQIKELRRRLKKQGDRLLITREPGGTVLGEDIRKILQRTVEGPDITDRAELLLFMASRAQLVTEVLEPALAAGKCIIADRFLDSSTVYQGVARGLGGEVVAAINRFAVGACLPNVTVLLDIEPSQARQRLGERGGEDRIEKLPESFFRDVRDGYLSLADEEPNRFVVIDAMKSMGEIAEEIWQAITERCDGLHD